jgi:hypothetical protein
MSNLAPSPSPLRPSNPMIRRKYPDAVLAEAVKLASTDGVAYAEKMTGVKSSSIYKAIRPPKPTTRKSATSKLKPVPPEKAFSQTALFKKAVALGEFFHSNVPGDNKRNAYARAAAKLGIDAGLLWKAWKYSQFTK